MNAHLPTSLDVVETDEDGEENQPSAEDIAAEKGDRERKLRQEAES